MEAAGEFLQLVVRHLVEVSDGQELDVAGRQPVGRPHLAPVDGLQLILVALEEVQVEDELASADKSVIDLPPTHGTSDIFNINAK